ncbi:fibronectin type III domain-containing protein [Bacillus sonorensis]|uniref:fibronectin type III domain-containing protein n=1 Tax=Bacillus sonorensis TaxID=119858 RepID=UPI00227E38CC|nr:fibronectin type III domain-containing protein [Bacillus sonorensis]MCY8035634.1 fibronectin type III domain-containing protein [Bacillus sonorensis]MCY8563695.1 fibronectin type III domain-containing protein [Bacillus sonorensis]MEC1428864.1 fibronectin type III domain-containing protein [Bacillus sonorensis]
MIPCRLLPEAPRNLRYDSTTDSITVEWNPVAGATAYNVYRGANKTFDKTVTEPKYVTTGMSPDTKLTINVTAVNEYGESAMSEIATQTKPSA